MRTYNYEKSQGWFKRAAEVLPCGIPGHMSPVVNIPVSDYPLFTERAQGSKFWDVDGNEFIDYMCAYGPMILGYGHPAVDKAALDQYKVANCTTGPTTLMVELAEYLVETVPIARWAFFAKNGGDITTYSTMIARKATGRRKIVAIKGGYHGVAPWMQSPGHPGTVGEDHTNVIRIGWNDFDAFERVVAENDGDVAGFIATPYHVPVFQDNALPENGYWEKVERLCKKKGIVLIVDDIRHGFRLNLGGSNEYFGFKPDLICFCKALANGYTISALVGTGELKNEAAKVFYTGSYWYQAAPMAAALACLKELNRINAPKIMLAQGEKLLTGLTASAKSHGFDLKVTGSPSMPYLRITNDESQMLHQEWCGECTKRGAFFASHHNWFMSTAHSDNDIEKTLEIADEAFGVLKRRHG
ncbi:MAG: aminotransferase class III-fold pyridoxal phosphate-dependent enzyme [Myxococcota bacterium]|jgi:glutamate-1-semialdehyde 2,1-aminomutase|nr:aminotransferase class III-fold pyridoxal phosphate-dependent enzyme [Myxococcota bacterium]